LNVFAPGEVIADENEEGEEKSETGSTKYQLIGVVVHSGQASGGHYYSYILHRSETLLHFLSGQFHQHSDVTVIIVSHYRHSTGIAY